jgi:hypothetical protein
MTCKQILAEGKGVADTLHSPTVIASGPFAKDVQPLLFLSKVVTCSYAWTPLIQLAISAIWCGLSGVGTYVHCFGQPCMTFPRGTEEITVHWRVYLSVSHPSRAALEIAPLCTTVGKRGGGGCSGSYSIVFIDSKVLRRALEAFWNLATSHESRMLTI